MITVAEAEARILEGAGPSVRERVPLAAAAGRVLAEDAAARRTHPPHDVSAMDGYAVRHADIAALPVTLSVGFAVAAGAMPRANGELAYHVLDTMLAITESIESGAPVAVTSVPPVITPLPEGWSPLVARP